MNNPLTLKLQGFLKLSAGEKRVLDGLHSQTITEKAGEDLIREGDRPRFIYLLMEGWAYRYKLLPDGGRQIMAYLIPGDLCDIHNFVLQRMDHNIGLLSDAQVGLVPEAAITDVIDNHKRLARALSWSTLVDEATLREWLVNSLRREPTERLAHLFCELCMRMRLVGLVNEDNGFDLPLTQAELGDTMGLNAVTINRVLQRLRTENLITLRAGRLTILDEARLQSICQFNPDYLHLINPPEGL